MYLNCHSYHSLRYGTIPVKDLVTQAAALNVKAMALTDINTVTGIYEFVKQCLAVDIKPLVGMEFRCEDKFRYIGLAKNRKGIGEMCRFLTQHNFDNTPLLLAAPDFEISPRLLRGFCLGTSSTFFILARQFQRFQRSSPTT